MRIRLALVGAFADPHGLDALRHDRARDIPEVPEELLEPQFEIESVPEDELRALTDRFLARIASEAQGNRQPTIDILVISGGGDWGAFGAGVLKGSSPEYGVGTVNYGSGTVAVTVGALPDVGSEIVYAWGGKANYFNRSDQTIAPPAVSLQLAQSGITPQSVTITWNDGAPRTATDDGAGRITGAATGTIHYQSGDEVVAETTVELVSHKQGD